ncbi:MAG TPA: archease [Deltaproteobacteria bacterium]|nr:archease [Deltaproteobacteria bacterium]
MPYRFIDHPADIGIHIVSKDRRGLFEEAAYAIIDILGAKCPDKDLQNQNITVEGLDLADTMVRWLQELLYHIEVKDLRVFSIKIDRIQETGLNAWVTGNHSSTGLEKEIKAVTYHNLEILEVDNHFETTIIFDT